MGILNIHHLIAELRIVHNARNNRLMQEGKAKETLTDQLCHVHSEVTEAYEAETREKFIDELWDIIFSAIAAGFTSDIPDDEIGAGMYRTLQKIQGREGIVRS